MKTKGAKIIVDCIAEQDARYVFGYPGGTIIDIFDELYKNTQLTHILTSHEQHACHAADGYSRASGRVGVVLATSGPGATNLVTGIANAYMDNIPLVAITGNVAVPLLGRDSFQEIDITGVTMPITKHNYIVKDISELADTIREAFYIAKDGCPGPVLVDIPKNVQQDIFEFSPKKPQPPKRQQLNEAQKSIEKAVQLIQNSKRPIIYAGGGVITSGASEALIKFSENGSIPMAFSMMGLGAVSCEHKNYLGMVGMHGSASTNKAVAASDAVIVVGARFSDRVATNREAFARDKIVVHIDIDPAQLDKNVKTNAQIIGDCKAALDYLNGKITPIKRDGWEEEWKAYKNDSGFPKTNSPLCPREILKEIKNAGGNDLTIATDVGQHQMWTAQSFPFTKPRTFISSGGLGAMGFGLGGAMGASFFTKKSTALITGDGSFHMNLNEVPTAVKYNLPIKIFVFNNRALGMVRQWQSLFYNRHHAGTVLENLPTDYSLLAEAFGAKYEKISQNSQISKVCKKVFSDNLVYIVECEIEKDGIVLPMIPPGKSSSEIIKEIKN